MNRDANNRAVGTGVGILFLLLSLPLNWFAIVRGDAGANAWGMVPSRPIPATGFSGNVSLFHVNLPIWLFVVAGLLALVFSMLNQRRITSLPRLFILVPGLIAAVYIGASLAMSVFSDEMTSGLGAWLALAGLGLGVYSALATFGRALGLSSAPFRSGAGRSRLR